MTGLPEPRDRARHTPAVSPTARETFLEAVAAAYSVTKAALLAGVHRSSFYRLRQADEEFAEQWADAFESGNDTVRDEIRRRAVEGWDEPVVSAGKVVTTIRRYSDRLLELEAKRRDPAYRDRPDVAIAIAGAGGMDAIPGPVQRGVSMVEVAKLLLKVGAIKATDVTSALAELEAGESTGEIVDVEDVPIEDGP